MWPSCDLVAFSSRLCVFSGADVLGGDAAPPGNVPRQARLLQRPAVMDRPRPPITANSAPKPHPPPGSVFPSQHLYISGNPSPPRPPAWVYFCACETITVVVFNHHKDWRTDIRCHCWSGVLLSFCSEVESKMCCFLLLKHNTPLHKDNWEEQRI